MVIVDSTKVVKWKFYHESGKLWKLGAYDKNGATALWKFYHENSQLKAKGNFEKASE